jgi:hypothetical protein
VCETFVHSHVKEICETKTQHFSVFFIIFLKDVLKRYFEKLSRHIHNRNPKEELGKVKTFHFYILSMSYLVVTDSDINPPARRVVSSVSAKIAAEWQRWSRLF